jgi:hypothetical protein
LKRQFQSETPKFLPFVCMIVVLAVLRQKRQKGIICDYTVIQQMFLSFLAPRVFYKVSNSWLIAQIAVKHKLRPSGKLKTRRFALNSMSAPPAARASNGLHKVTWQLWLLRAGIERYELLCGTFLSGGFSLSL